MKFTFISAHAVYGLANQLGNGDTTLFDELESQTRVVLTNQPERHLYAINRNAALLEMLLTGGIPQPLPEDFAASIDRVTSAVAQRRLSESGATPIVVIEIVGDVAAKAPDHARDILDFTFGFDAFDKKAVRTTQAPSVLSILSGIRIGAAQDVRFKFIADGCYLKSDSGKMIYSATFEGGAANIFHSRPLLREAIDDIAANISGALKDPILSRALRLHGSALDLNVDPYRAFISSWNALEILIGKLFPAYQSRLKIELASLSSSPALHLYLERVASVMSTKHSLTDKFAVVSYYLAAASEVEGRLANFKSLKEVRDKISHGQDVEDQSLPVREVQRIFDAYFRSHLNRTRAAISA
jgi:hypothetical protein